MTRAIPIPKTTAMQSRIMPNSDWCSSAFPFCSSDGASRTVAASAFFFKAPYRVFEFQSVKLSRKFTVFSFALDIYFLCCFIFCILVLFVREMAKSLKS